MYDDVGAKLLSLYYRSERQENAELAKSALNDLRDLLSAEPDRATPLTSALAHWRDEAHSRVEDRDIELHWSQQLDKEDLELSARQFANLSRMLRESLSNAIRHGQNSSFIRVTVLVRDSSLSFDVQNDGCLQLMENWQLGRGISSMRQRARELGGELSIKVQQGIATLVWTVPVSKNDANPDS